MKRQAEGIFAAPAADRQIVCLNNAAAPSIFARSLMFAQVIAWLIFACLVALVLLLVLVSNRPIFSYGVTESGIVSELESLPPEQTEEFLRKAGIRQ